MTRINNKEEFIRIYPYTEDQIKYWPESYPCFCEVHWIDEGLGADHREIEIVYPPTEVGLASFEAGLSAR